jgi:hypothetical protein
MKNGDDLDRFRIVANALPALPRAARESAAQRPADHQSVAGAERRTWFLRGPVPLPWLAEAGRLRGRALDVGVCLWFLVGVSKNRLVRLSRPLLTLFDLDRHAVYRALRQMERASLVQVDRGKGRRPVVLVIAGKDLR